MNDSNPIELILSVVRESYPDISEESLCDIIKPLIPKFFELIIEEIERELPHSAAKVELPSDSQSRLTFAQQVSHAKRSRTQVRASKIFEAELTRDAIKEIDKIRQRYAETGDTQKADQYAEYISIFRGASNEKDRIYDYIDNDMTSNLTYIQDAEDRTNRRLRGLIPDGDK